MPLSMLNRHGLVAGATGTGKTKTLQLIAEQLSDAGVPVFLADIKGDCQRHGRARASRATASPRAPRTPATDWQATGFPAEFLNLGGQGGTGVPVRATMTSFGPLLLSKVLGLNETQESSLGLVFHFADKAGPAAARPQGPARRHLAPDQRRGQGRPRGARRAVVARPPGVILRELIGLEDNGGDVFFGEPEFDTHDLMRTTPDGKGVLSIMELQGLQASPQLFSTFLMWLLADLFHDLPEMGDVEKPKLVFFFDEAHLLFDGASQGLPRRDRADRPAHPLQGRRRLLRDADPQGRARRRARPARQPGAARAARLHPRRREGAQGDRRHVPEERGVRRPRGAAAARSASARRSSRSCRRTVRRPRSRGPGCARRPR